MNDFELFMKFYAENNYSDLIMQFFALIAIIAGLLFVRKDKTALFFLAYLSFDLFISLSDTYIQVFSSFTRSVASLYINLTNTLISLVELLVYYYFFSKILQSKPIIKLMRISAFFFFVVIIILLTTKYSFMTDRFPYVTEIIVTLEFLCLIPPCFVYFYQLFQSDITINLYQRPSFWIVIGIFIYSVVSVPYYLISSYITVFQTKFWSLTYLFFFCIPLCVNFIFLSRAFLCKKTVTI